MDQKHHLGDRHRQRSDEARRMRIAFCAALAALLRQRQAKGADIKGVQYQAAKIAGFGVERPGVKGSWDPFAAYQHQRAKSTRLMKETFVREELQRLGLQRDETKRQWYDPSLPRRG